MISWPGCPGGCLSAPISHPIRRTAEHPLLVPACKPGAPEQRGSGVSTRTAEGWGGGAGYRELSSLSVLVWGCHLARCEIKLRSTEADSNHLCSVGVQPPRRAECFFHRLLYCVICMLLCTCNSSRPGF